MDVKLLRHSVWYPGRLLAFSGLDGPTDYARGLVLRTLPEPGAFALKLPENARITPSGRTPNDFFTSGDAFYLEDDYGILLRGVFADAHHLLLEGACGVHLEGDGLHLLSASHRTLLGTTEHFDPTWLDKDFDEIWRQRLAWLHGVNPPPDMDPAFGPAFARALALMKTQIYSPEGSIAHHWSTPDRWPHRDMWLWDSAFHAIGWRHIDANIAKELIDAVLSQREASGFIAHQMNPRTHSGLTQPPVLAWAAWLVHEASPDPEWLADIYPDLCAYVDWDVQHRESDGFGLLEWALEDNRVCRCAECGMDNSNRFDSGHRLDAVDLNSYLSQECLVLSHIAKVIGREESQAYWRGRNAHINALMRQRFWSEEQGLFLDYDLDEKRQSPVRAVSGFLPLICGGASREQAARLLGHLADPATFGTPLPLPSVAADDPGFALDMWRGPVWINLNWMIAEGLDRMGHRKEADMLRRQTCGEILRRFAQHGTFFEYFDPHGKTPPPKMMRKGQCAPEKSPYHQVFFDYGWTTCLFVDWMYRGVKPEIPELAATV